MIASPAIINRNQLEACEGVVSRTRYCTGVDCLRSSVLVSRENLKRVAMTLNISVTMMSRMTVT
jgi:hypothetical protein